MTTAPTMRGRWLRRSMAILDSSAFICNGSTGYPLQMAMPASRTISSALD